VQQLDLPFKSTFFQRSLFKAKDVLNYAVQHPSDVLLALLTVLLIDIENDLDDLEGN
jgi:hypothetical protein